MSRRDWLEEFRQDLPPDAEEYWATIDDDPEIEALSIDEIIARNHEEAAREYDLDWLRPAVTK